MNELLILPISQLAHKLHGGEVSAVEVTKATLDRIAKTKDLNNFTVVTAEQAITDAVRADERIKHGTAGPLCGVPVAVKDNINIAGVKTTCASRAVNITPDENADVVNALKNAGAVIIGKTNMDELAMGSTNESSIFGAVKNALDTSCVAGGSSGGSANAVCANQVFASLGSDTGGSVRQPAAFCGILGLKPTLGRLSTRGLVGCSPSLDTLGIFARSAADASLVFSALNGENLQHDLQPDCFKNLTVGAITEALEAAEMCEVADDYIRAVGMFIAGGARVVKVSVPSFTLALSVYHILSSAEAVNTLSGKDGKGGLLEGGQADLLGDEVKRRMIAGAYMLSGARYENLYIKAAKLRTRIKHEFAAALKNADVLVTPTAPTAALKIGASTDPHTTHGSDMFLSPVSLAGLPALSVPCGKVRRLPIGLQIIGGANCEQKILSVAAQFEKVSAQYL